LWVCLCWGCKRASGEGFNQFHTDVHTFFACIIDKCFGFIEVFHAKLDNQAFHDAIGKLGGGVIVIEVIECGEVDVFAKGGQVFTPAEEGQVKAGFT
jgi:hypothetical protein